MKNVTRKYGQVIDLDAFRPAGQRHNSTTQTTMPLSRLKEFLFHILTPVLEMRDGELFHAHQWTTDHPDDSWFGLLANFTAPLSVREVYPQICGRRITPSWLRGLDPDDCVYQFR